MSFIVYLVRDGFESLGANIFDDRGREAIPHPNQEIDVAPIVDPHKIFHPTSVHVGHGFHGEGRSLDHEVVDGEGLFLGQQLVKPRPGCQQRTELRPTNTPAFSSGKGGGTSIGPNSPRCPR